MMDLLIPPTKHPMETNRSLSYTTKSVNTFFMFTSITYIGLEHLSVYTLKNLVGDGGFITPPYH